MAESGHAIDALFASSFLATMSESLPICSGRDGHWRPKAKLPPPFGSIASDFGCSFRGPKGEILLIVEREGSAPGNERNILKWHAAVSRGAELYLESGSQRIRCRPDAVLLVLAFGRPPKWDRSDFEKTVAFCELLAEIINRQDLSGRTPLRVLVRKYPPEASDWKECACWMAQQVLAAL